MIGRDCGWQGLNAKVKDRLKYLLENSPVPPDCSFFVGPPGHQTKIPAHKLPLVIGSEVFFAMFYGPAVKITEQYGMHVEISDISAEAFQAMLRFLYTDETDMNLDNVMDIIQCADKYAIPELYVSCLAFLRNQERFLSLDWSQHLCRILTRSQELNQPEVEWMVWKAIEKDAKRVLSHDSFLEISHALLCEILDRAHLSASEIEVYRGALMWARASCGEGATAVQWRLALGDAFHRIRFACMTPQELIEGPIEDGLISLQEQSDIFRQIFKNKINTTNCVALYTDEARIPVEPILRGFISLAFEEGNEKIKLGRLEIEPRFDLAPKTSALFIKLCERRYPFVIRFRKRTIWTSLNFPDSPFSLPELLPAEKSGLLHDKYGTVSMSRKTNESNSAFDDHDGPYMELRISADPTETFEEDENYVVFGRLVNCIELLLLVERWEEWDPVYGEYFIYRDEVGSDRS